MLQKKLNSYIYPLLLIILSLGITLQNYFMGENHFWGDVAYTHYNNFIIFKDSFFHLIHQQNLYVEYPAEYADLYKYSPTFALFMGLFAFLPNWLGLFLWNFIGCAVLFYALNKLITDKKKLLFAFIFILPELILTTQNSQSNALLAGFILLAFDALQKEKNNLAALLIVATVFIKLFTLVAFLLFLFYPNKLKSARYVFMWTFIFLLLPVFVIGLHGLQQQYVNWLELLKSDHSISYGLSLVGFLNTLHLFEVNKTLVLLFGVLVLLLPLINYKQWHTSIYKQNYLCLILIWMVIFNHKAESPSYIICRLRTVGLFKWLNKSQGNNFNFMLYIFSAYLHGYLPERCAH